MAQPTASEQLMLELVNRARLDPAAEAARTGVGLNDGLTSGSIDSSSKEPLVVNYDHVNSARQHSEYMFQNGLEPSTNGENVSGRYLGGSTNIKTTVSKQHADLFKNATARYNLLNESFTQVGIGQVLGDYGPDNRDASFITQQFLTGGPIYLTGVVYNDIDGDGFYSGGTGQNKEGRSGVDVAVGGPPIDTMTEGGYRLATSAGTRTISIGTAELRATIVNENAKIDLINGNHIDSSVSIELLSNVKSARLLGTNDLSLKGSSASETLTGNKGDNALDGKGGNDTIRGGSGEDTIRGGSGNDRLYGDSGADNIIGEDGDDFIDGGSSSDILRGGAGMDAMIGGTGNDKLYGDADVDNMTGGDNNDLVDGGSGGDTLRGGSGDDQLIGGSGNDFLLGESGVDRLYGGSGKDQLTGGSSGDTFIYKATSESTMSTRDSILDFSRSAGDKVDLSAVDANTKVSGNQTFTWIGENNYTGKAGEFRITHSGSDIVVYGDTNGDKASDFSIHFDNLESLYKSDFLL